MNVPLSRKSFTPQFQRAGRERGHEELRKAATGAGMTEPVVWGIINLKDQKTSAFNDKVKVMKKGRLTSLLMIISLLLLVPLLSMAGEQDTFLVHLKTSLKKDDAQICVAYNMMWAALDEGFKVKVLVDADAINTFKVGWRGSDDIEGYKIPENLRQALAKQFRTSLDKVPKTYGDFLLMLKDRGVEFYINSGFLIVSKIGTPDNLLDKVSNKFFKPVTLKEMVRIRTEAKYYMAY
jgi:hypothetical protein